MQNKTEVENDKLEVIANNNAIIDFNETGINVLASSKLSKISDAHGAHFVVSSDVIEHENRAVKALAKNNLQKCEILSFKTAHPALKLNPLVCSSVYYCAAFCV